MKKSIVLVLLVLFLSVFIMSCSGEKEESNSVSEKKVEHYSDGVYEQVDMTSDTDWFPSIKLRYDTDLESYFLTMKYDGEWNEEVLLDKEKEIDENIYKFIQDGEELKVFLKDEEKEKVTIFLEDYGEKFSFMME